MELKEGIIVKTIKYKESSKIVYLLTKEGLFSGLVRNCLNLKSKNYSYSHEAILIGFDIQKSKNNNSFDIITSGKVIDNFINIHGNYNKLLVILEMFSIVMECCHNVDNYEKLYDLTALVLKMINSNTLETNDKFYLLIFKLKLLYLSGVGPHVTECVECGKKDYVSFSIENGGVVCREHKKSSLISSETTEILKILYLGKIDLFTEEIFKSFDEYYYDVANIVEKYYEHHLPLNSKTKKIIKNLKV